MSQMLMAIFVAYSNAGITESQNIKHSFSLTSELKTSYQIMQEKYIHGDDVIDDVTEWPQSHFSIFLYE